MNRHLLFLSIALVLIAIAVASWPETGRISGKVITSDDVGIPGATIKLLSSLERDPYDNPYATTLSKPNGLFELQFPWEEIKQEDQKGANWSLFAEKEGYISSSRDLFLSSSGEFRPEKPDIEMKSAPYQEYYPKLHYYRKGEEDIEILSLFDLNFLGSDRSEADLFHDSLVRHLNSGIPASLAGSSEGSDILGGIDLQVKWCPVGVPVKTPDMAIDFGEQIGSPGVMWGFASDREIDGEMTILLSMNFHSLNGKTVWSSCGIPYKEDDHGSIRFDEHPHEAYLAFSSFVLGRMHLHAGELDLARRCFRHASELDVLTDTLETELEEKLKFLDESSNPSANLTTLRGGQL
jgi:hypothetical protein